MSAYHLNITVTNRQSKNRPSKYIMTQTFPVTSGVTTKSVFGIPPIESDFTGLSLKA